MSGFMHSSADIVPRSSMKTVLLAALLLLAACAGPPSDQENMQADIDWGAIARATEEQISWREEVQPCWNSAAVVCHGCFDAPCQLKLTAFSGSIMPSSGSRLASSI